MNKQLTPRQVARAMGVSEASLKRGCDRGLIPSVRTAGGHRRLDLGAVMQFLRESGRSLPSPEFLGLPSTVARGPRVLATAGGEAVSALATGDAERCRGLVFSLYVAGHSVAEIGDEVIAPAFAALGSQWRDGILAVYEERRACEIVIRILHELRRALPRVATDAPLAAGGTLSGDPYTVANTMVEVVLREAGWRTVNLGCGLPVAAIAAAVIDLRPQLLWLSLSEPGPAEGLPAGAAALADALRATGTLVAAGGRAVGTDVLAALPGAVATTGLQDLTILARAAAPQLAPPAAPASNGP